MRLATPTPPPDLVDLARKAIAGSYAPYSDFRVSAALRTNHGAIHVGANVENAAYSPGNCAERSAIFKAVNDRSKRVERPRLDAHGKPLVDSMGKPVLVGAYETIAVVECVVYVPKPTMLVTPCGVCRQVLREFCGGDPQSLRLWAINDGEEWESWSLEELLPDSFGPENLA